MVPPQHLVVAAAATVPDSDSPASIWIPSYKVFGADTSLWSLEVDFEKYRLANASFVIVKALHGVNIDPFFSRNYARARAASVPVSTYQWLLPESVLPIKEQVRTYADLLRDYPHDFVPWLDFEGEAAPRRNGVQEFRISSVGRHGFALDVFADTPTGNHYGLPSTSL